MNQPPFSGLALCRSKKAKTAGVTAQGIPGDSPEILAVKLLIGIPGASPENRVIGIPGVSPENRATHQSILLRYESKYVTSALWMVPRNALLHTLFACLHT